MSVLKRRFRCIFPVTLIMDDGALNTPHVRFLHPMQWQTIYWYPFGMVSYDGRMEGFCKVTILLLSIFPSSGT